MIDTSFMTTIYDFETAVDELLDDALNKLSHEEYEQLLDSIDVMLSERND